MEREKYYLYIDECGDQNLSNFDANFPIFTLCGIIVSESMRDKLDSQILELKKTFWGLPFLRATLTILVWYSACGLPHLRSG